MRAILVGFLALLLQGILAGLLRLGGVLIWFESQAHGVSLADKADYLSALLEAPLPPAFALSLAAFPAGVLFARFSAVHSRQGLWLFCLLLALFVVLSLDTVLPAFVGGVGCFMFCFLGVSLFRRGVQPVGMAPEESLRDEPDFEAKVQALRERQQATIAARRKG